MGANATTTVPVYVAAEVLTAADLNITNSGIPVFATTVTRDAGFGGAGEKTLAEGQFAYIEATDTTQYYDGSAWQTLGSTPGLKCIKAETAFTAAATVSLDSIFTSTYTNYRILFNCFASGGGTTARFQLRTGGVAAATNYNWSWIYMSGGVVTAANGTATTEIQIGLADATPIYTSFAYDIFAPQLAQQTNVTGQAHKGNNLYNVGGTHTTATAYDGFQFYATGGATFTGTYAVYGYSKSV
jgi:hypothetical protein